MNLLIAFVPALGWGLVPLIVNKIKGEPVSQVFGMGVGATIVGLLVALFNGVHLTTGTFILALIVGALWTIGQFGQFISFTRMGVSNTIPLSTVFQLVGNSLIGVLIFGEWSAGTSKLIGFAALLLVILGAVSTSITDHADNGISVKNILFLLASTVGYWIYSSFPKAVSADGRSLLLPEMLGILIGALIYMGFTGQMNALKLKASWLNTFVGVSFGVGSLFYIYSVQMNGIASAFIYSQLSSIIATLGGIFLLHESKSSREMTFTIIGLGLIVGGSALTGII